MTELPADHPALGLYQVIREDGSTDPAHDPFLDESVLLGMFEQMLRIRLLDERMLMRQRQGKVGFYGTITGQEATPIATAFATEQRDWIFPALREAAIMLVRGFPLPQWLAQVYGNEADLLKGRQMPSHMSARQVNQVSWGSCIASQIPQAVGVAWAAKMKGHDTVSIGFMGDGATSEPDFHCAMNFAGVFKTPAVLICQNNQWSISVPTNRQTASETIAIKAHAYGIPGIRVDGNDILAVYNTVKQAVTRARAGEGATFIEAVTYRIGPHSSSDDPSLYRSDEEVDAWKRRDPIVRFDRFLRRAGLLDDAKRAELESAITAEILSAIREVESLPPPTRGTLFEDVYGSMPWHLEEQLEQLLEHDPAPSH